MRQWHRLFVGAAFLIASHAAYARSPEDPTVITRDNAAQVELLGQIGGDQVMDLEWSPDGTQVAVFSKHALSVYDANDLQTAPYILEMDPCHPIPDTPEIPCDGKLVYASSDTLIVGSDLRLRTYNLESKQRLGLYEVEGGANQFAYNPNGGLISFGGRYGNVFLMRGKDMEATHPDDFLSSTFQSDDRQWFMPYGNPILGTAISPNGRWLAMSNGNWHAYSDNVGINLYDLDLIANLEETAESDVYDAYPAMGIESQEDILQQLAFSPDSTLLVSGDSDGLVRLWNMPDASSRAVLSGHGGTISDIVFSPDGRTLASASGDGSIRLWDIASHETHQVINGMGTSITAISFSPDGTRLAAGGWDGSLWIFDTVTGDMSDSRPAHWGSIWQMAINPEGTLLAVGKDNNEVVLYDILNTAPYLNERMTLKGHEGMVYAVDFHPDGVHLASGSSDGMIIVWDTSRGEIVKTEKQETTIFDLAYSPDGQCLVFATKNGYNSLIDSRNSPTCFDGLSNINNEGFRQQTTITDGIVYSVAFNPQGTILAVTDETSLYLVYKNTGMVSSKTMRHFASESYQPEDRSKLVFSQDGRVILNSGYFGGSLIFVDNSRPSIGVGALALSTDGTLAAGQGLDIYDVETGEMLREQVMRDLWSIRDALFTPDNHLIITADIDGTLSVWGIPPRED